ncbi:hypothetical protein HJC23_010275 [Cyclotella cryptica]|uniref:Uncharacterized protein n=1 Tax=Cyclotella cryptica TaxID=29204 RepID=A0ABD3QPL5_9STRA
MRTYSCDFSSGMVPSSSLTIRCCFTVGYGFAVAIDSTLLYWTNALMGQIITSPHEIANKRHTIRDILERQAFVHCAMLLSPYLSSLADHDNGTTIIDQPEILLLASAKSEIMTVVYLRSATDSEFLFSCVTVWYDTSAL